MSGHVDAENPFAGQGSVLLDIGGDVGALVVTMPAAMAGIEVEIRPVDSRDHSEGQDHGHQHGEPGHEPGHQHVHEHGEHIHAHHPHVAVVERPVDGGVVPSLVFPELVEGHYELYVKQTEEIQLWVEVRGGEVTMATWPA